MTDERINDRIDEMSQRALDLGFDRAVNFKFESAAKFFSYYWAYRAYLEDLKGMRIADQYIIDTGYSREELLIFHEYGARSLDKIMKYVCGLEIIINGSSILESYFEKVH